MLVSVVVIWYFGGDFIASVFKKDTIFTEPNMAKTLNQSDLNLTLKDASALEVSIDPKEINPLQQVTFIAKNRDAKDVQVVIYGLNMNMGYHRHHLSKTPDGSFRVTIVLPSCSIEMKWQANFEIQKDSGLYGGGFILWSKK